MKTFSKFASLIAALLALIALILLVSTNAMVNGNLTYSGQLACFGGKSLLGDISPAWSGLLAFIFILIAILTLAVSAVAVFANIKPLKKYSSLINLFAACLLILAGIFAFLVVVAKDATDFYSIGAGWVIAGILSILAGFVATCPIVLKKSK